MLLLYNVKSATAVLSGNELEFSSASVVVETVTLASASDTLSFSASVNSSGTEFLVEKAAPDAIHAAAAPDVTSTIIVSSGVTSSGLYVDHLDTLEVLSGGKVIDTTVRGFETISAGGLATGDVVDASIIGASSGLQFVLGVASSTVVHAGGYQVVSSGGRADGSRVGSGGFEFITAGGHASGGVIRSGGYEFVATTGVVTGVHIRDYGDLELSDAGAYGDGVGGGGVTVGAVDDDGRINVRSNGVASSSIVNSGGLVSVTASGEIVGTYLRSGGVIQVASGESVSARVSAGALEIVFYGESLSDYVYSGGTAAVVDSATISALVVSSGGLFDWFNRAASVSDLRLHPGAEISVSATSAVAIISGGVLEVMSQGGAVIFDTATLEGGGSGLTLTSGVYSSGYTEFTVEKATPDAAARPALLAQAIAAMPANNPLSPMVFHDGTVSAAVHVIGTTS